MCPFLQVFVGVAFSLAHNVPMRGKRNAPTYLS